MVTSLRAPDSGDDPTCTHPKTLNVLALFKGTQERNIFVYDDASIRELLRTFRDKMLDPDSLLNGHDAIVLADRVHQGLKRDGLLHLLPDHP